MAWMDFFFIAVFQRALAGAAVLSLTSVPGVSADRITLIGWSKRAALRQLAPGHQVTTPWETPRGTTSIWRAPSPRQPETPPAYQDPYWAAGAHSARWGGGQRAEGRGQGAGSSYLTNKATLKIKGYSYVILQSGKTSEHDAIISNTTTWNTRSIYWFKGYFLQVLHGT